MFTDKFTVIDYDELDELMCKYWQLDTFESSLESPNDTCYLHRDIKKEEHDYWAKQSLAEIKDLKACQYFDVGNLLQELVNNDILPEDNYIFKVSW